MKSIFISAVIVTIFSIFSCKKDGSNYQSSIGLLNEANQTIIGKWNLVSDSTYTGFAQYQQPYDYTGKPGDYFDFRTDGKVYTKEGATLDTLSYSIMPNNQLIISSFGGKLNGVPEVSNVTSSGNQIVIFAPWLYTPGGVIGRKVTLSI